MRPLLILLTATAALAQTPETPVAFDAVSVKPASAPGGRGGMRLPEIKATPGMVVARLSSLRSCIAWAYNVLDQQVSGPDWMDQQRFDITGKAAGPADEATLRVMMQAMLLDRFKLAFHRQNKEVQAYVLTVGKNGPKFKESKTEGEMNLEPNQSQMSVSVQHAPLSQLTSLMSQMLRGPVVDNTGLTGRYDINVNLGKWISDAASRGPELANDPSALLVPILAEEFGLKLESKKMPLDLLVIDHIEKTPTEN
ncbi:MAG: TIGR03435 family protein [Candidatus Solibacter sp.]